jgi:hypothetical protein
MRYSILESRIDEVSMAVSPKKQLRECDRWPTMQWFGVPVRKRLDELVSDLRDSGISARRSGVVGALVLGWNDPSADGLWDLIRPFKVQHATPHKPRRGGAVPIKLRLPSPISLRVDGLVGIARTIAPVYRHDLLGALIMDPSVDPSTLEQHWLFYWNAKVEAAAIPGVSKRLVLSEKRPEPGPRPMA